MRWLYTHIVDVGYWMEVLVGCYTVYMGIQVQRRRNLESRMKLTPGELAIALALVVVDCFLLGIHAIYVFAPV